MTNGMNSRGLALWVVLLFLGLMILWAHNIMWYEFIWYNFTDHGEFYYKSEGMIFRDDFKKGLLLTVADPTTFWVILAFITTTLLPQERVIFQIFGVFAVIYAVGIVLYGTTKSYDLYQGTFDNSDRVIAIVSAGFGRILGALLGAWSAWKLDVYGKLTALIARTKYDKQLHRLS